MTRIIILTNITSFSSVRYLSQRRPTLEMNFIFPEGLMCLSTSGNYTQVEILTGNS